MVKYTLSLDPSNSEYTRAPPYVRGMVTLYKGLDVSWDNSRYTAMEQFSVPEFLGIHVKGF